MHTDAHWCSNQNHNYTMTFFKEIGQLRFIHSEVVLIVPSCYGNFGPHVSKLVKNGHITEVNCPGSVYSGEVKWLDFGLERWMPMDISLRPEILLWTSNSRKYGKNMLSVLEIHLWPPIIQTTEDPMGVRGAGHWAAQTGYSEMHGFWPDLCFGKMQDCWWKFCLLWVNMSYETIIEKRII